MAGTRRGLASGTPSNAWHSILRCLAVHILLCSRRPAATAAFGCSTSSPTCVHTAVFLAHLRVTVFVPAADPLSVCRCMVQRTKLSWQAPTRTATTRNTRASASSLVNRGIGSWCMILCLAVTCATRAFTMFVRTKRCPKVRLLPTKSHRHRHGHRMAAGGTTLGFNSTSRTKSRPSAPVPVRKYCSTRIVIKCCMHPSAMAGCL